MRVSQSSALLMGAIAALAFPGCDIRPSDDGGITPTPTATPEPPTETPVPTGPKPIVFPEDFLFGTATAGFQVEMGCPTVPRDECEDPNSDWFVFTTSEEMIADPNNYLNGDHPSDVSPGHWELYPTDADNAAHELMNNGLRIGIEWSRIFPEPTDDLQTYEALRAAANPDAIAHYHHVLAELKKQGLTPLVTINHYTLPTWIHDAIGCHQDLANCSPRGWLDVDRMVREISKYAGFLGREFGSEVDLWGTLNEPLAVVLAGYLFPSEERTNPPSVSFADVEALTVFNAMIEAHARMYDAVQDNDTEDADGDGVVAQIGIVYNMAPAAPADPEDETDVQGAENVFYLYNLAFLNAVALGQYDEDLDGSAVFRADLANRMDYIGINYYTRVTVEGTKVPLLPSLSVLTTFNPYSMEVWEDYPQGIYEMTMVVEEEYDLPVIITENGTQDPNDEAGSSFLVRHLTWLSRAMDDGADVRGYFYWTLMDNYEWNHGSDIKMGLYAVDPADPDKTRVPRKSVATYAGIASSNTISVELQNTYPAD